MRAGGDGQATRYAAILAISYVLVAASYIAVSGELAAEFSASLADLQHVELVKGLAFVALTGALLFGLAHVLFRRLERAAEHLARSREALLRADRQATPGLLAASIAHDFNNVLAVLQANVDLLADDLPADMREETIEDLRIAIRRGSELAKTLSHAGKSSASGAPSSVDLEGVVGEALELVRHHRKAKHRELVLEAPPATHHRVPAYPTLVHQVVTNLALNALDAVPEGGHVLVRVDERGDGRVSIEVHDDGPGVPPELREQLFDPFYTTKDDGTGLGLVSVRTCAELHQGKVEVLRSERLGGALFRVELGKPVAPSASV